MLDLQRIYAEYIALKQEERSLKYEKHRGWFGASSSGYCHKKQYYKLQDTAIEEIDDRVNRLLRLGTIVHSDFEKAIKAYNKTHKTKIETEKEIRIPHLKVIGHLDILETEGDINRVYDIKTVASYKWRMKFRRIKADPNSDINYNLQLGTYGMGINSDPSRTELYLCWYNKDNSMMKEPVKVDSEWMLKAEEYWIGLRNDISKWIDNDMKPDDILAGITPNVPVQTWECKYCQYSTQCNSPYS